jgi:hypothetical protein
MCLSFSMSGDSFVKDMMGLGSGLGYGNSKINIGIPNTILVYD